MTDQILKEHQINKEVPNEKFGYQLASIVLIILLIRLYIFGSIFLLDYFFIFTFLFLVLISKFKKEYISPIKKVWLKFSIYLAKFMNPIILFIIFIVCFVPIGFLYKMFKLNNFKTKINNDRKSYWEKPEDQKVNFEDQF
ncbi:hypothetical protein OAJ03_01385 [Candidatus Pelagibacter sp.]|nr:hypothetical protein [Candidatus Pelagibacter sp.]